MLVLKHWKCIDASEGGNQYEKQALSRRQAALKKRLSLIYRVYLQEDAVLEGCFWRRGFLEGIASGACVQDKTCEDKKRSWVSLYIGERHDSEGGRKKARKEKQETKRQGDKARESKREIRTCSNWSINWNIQLLNKQHLFHCKAASR